MNFDVVFLGTGAAIPVPTRGTTSQFVNIHDHTYLIDAGEGVQLALRKSGIRFQKLKGIFISHMHGDHVLGLPGLLSTMSLLGRRDQLQIWGPSELGNWLEVTWKSIQAHLSFDVEVKSWTEGVSQVLVEQDHYRLISVPAKHRIPCCGLKIEEHSLPWKLDGVRARAAGMPHHVRQALKRGEVAIHDGQSWEPSFWCTPPREPRSYLYSSDTRPTKIMREAAENVTLLYHEATFSKADAERAKATYHSTTVEAARLASQAGAKQLLLGHVSLRYRNLELLLEEAREWHEAVEMASDGLIWRL